MPGHGFLAALRRQCPQSPRRGPQSRPYCPHWYSPTRRLTAPFTPRRNLSPSPSSSPQRGCYRWRARNGNLRRNISPTCSTAPRRNISPLPRRSPQGRYRWHAHNAVPRRNVSPTARCPDGWSDWEQIHVVSPARRVRRSSPPATPARRDCRPATPERRPRTSSPTRFRFTAQPQGMRAAPLKLQVQLAQDNTARFGERN